MATPTTTPLPPGVSPPYAAITAVDQAGLIAILAGFSLGLVVLSAGVRLYARRYSGRARWDDCMFLGAVCFAIIQTSLVFYMIARGLGKLVDSLSSEQLVAIKKAGFISDLFYLVVLFFSKSSCAFLFLWISPYKAQRRIIWALFGASCVSLVTSVFVEAFRCAPGREWFEGAVACKGFLARWVYIGVFDMLIEIALVLMSAYIIWARQMALMAKVVVVAAFACRIPNIALTIVRLVFLAQTFTPSDSDNWAAGVISTTQLAVGYTITACVIPYLRPLMQAYEREEGRRSSGEPSFKMSERSSRGSGSAAAGWRGHTRKASLAAAAGDSTQGGEGGSGGIQNKYRLEPIENQSGTKAAERDAVKRDVPLEEGDEKEHEESGRNTGLVIQKEVDWSVEYDKRRQSLRVGSKDEKLEATAEAQKRYSRKDVDIV